MPEQNRHHPRRGIDWDIFEARSSRGRRIEIERCDDSSFFTSDEEAAGWVLLRACDRTSHGPIRDECRDAVRTLVATWEDEETRLTCSIDHRNSR